MSAYRASISDRGRTKTGVVVREFPTFGLFMFREDGADESRMFRTEWWRIRPTTDREVGRPVITEQGENRKEQDR